ncbi:MAG: WD40 domain-containing protein [bacterium]
MKWVLITISVVLFGSASFVLYAWYVHPEWLPYFFPSNSNIDNGSILGFFAALFTASATPAALAALISNKKQTTELSLRELTKNNNANEVLEPNNSFLDIVEAACQLQYKDRSSIIKRHEKHNFPHLSIETKEYNILSYNIVAIIEYNINKTTLHHLINKIDKYYCYRRSDPHITVEVIYGGDNAKEIVKKIAVSQRIKLIHLSEYKGLLDFKNYLKQQKQRLETSPIYPSQLYVNQRLRYGNQDEPNTTDNAIQTISAWLQQDHGQFLLILGEFGTGKTFLLRELVRRFHDSQQHIIPILLEMRSLEKTADLNKLLAQQLAADMPFDGEKFYYMLNQGQIILFFDGFDELALRVTYQTALEHFDTLIQAAQGGKAKVVVTSRTQHFKNKQQVKLKLMEHVESLKSHRITELLGFDQQQILKYLENHLNDKNKALQRLKTISCINDLMGLSENPRMLSFIAQLSEQQLETAKNAKGEISTASLYQIILENWINLEQKRSNTGRKDDLKLEQRWQAITELALFLWGRTEKTIHLDDLNEDVITTLENINLDYDTTTQQIGSGTLLVRDENSHFEFIHQSVMEWLLAKNLALAFSQRDTTPLDHLLSLQAISSLMADFLCDLVNSKHLVTWAKYHDNSSHITLQKNARTILKRLNIREHIGVNYSGHDLQGEDFSGQDLSYANFSHANLTNANFDQAILIACNFSHAQCAYTAFKQANCQQANFSYANLSRANFNAADLTDAEFDSANLCSASLLDIRHNNNFWTAKNLRLLKYLGSLPKNNSSHDHKFFGASCIQPKQFKAQHQLPISAQAITFHPKFPMIATISGDCITLWNTMTSTCLNTLKGHQNTILSVVFSPDGRQLASASADHTLKLWETNSGKCLQTFDGHYDIVLSVIFSPNGLTLTSSSFDQTLKLWNISSGECINTFQGHKARVWSIAFSPDGSTLASGSADNTLKLWNVDSGQCLSTLQGHQARIWSIAFSPDGNTLVSGSADHTLKIWSINNNECLNTLREHTNKVLSVAFSPDGYQLVSGSADNTLKLWNTQTGVCLNTFKGHNQMVSSVAFNANGTQLASGSTDNTIKIWNIHHNKCTHTFKGYQAKIWSVAFSPKGNQLISGSDDHTLRLWDTYHGKCLNTLRGHSARVWSVAFSSDGGKLVSGSSDNTIKLWDMHNGQCLKTFKGHQARIWSVAFSPNNKKIASGSDDHTVRLWETSHSKYFHTLRGHQSRVWSVAFSPDGTKLASGSADCTLKLWDVNSCGCLRTFKGHQEIVWSIMFSPDNTKLASGSADCTLKLWDTHSGNCLNTFQGHQDWIRSVAFSPDGKQLISGSDDHTLKLWDIHSGKCLRTLVGHQYAVNSVTFSPNGLWVASGSYDNSIRLWRIKDGICVAIFVTFEQGWVAYTPNGHYKHGGNLQGNFWHSINLCRFEVGELDPYWHEPLRLKDNEPLVDSIILPASASN